MTLSLLARYYDSRTDRWPGHQRQRTALSREKLWPVHRSFIAMSGSWVQAEERAAYGIGFRVDTSPPGGLLRSDRRLVWRQREQRQRDAARDRANNGVYVFTRVNASGIRQLKEKQPVRGSCRSNQGSCGVNVWQAKGRGRNRHPGALARAQPPLRRPQRVSASL
jgi:hypothetical protein